MSTQMPGRPAAAPNRPAELTLLLAPAGLWGGSHLFIRNQKARGGSRGLSDVDRLKGVPLTSRAG